MYQNISRNIKTFSKTSYTMKQKEYKSKLTFILIQEAKKINVVVCNGGINEGT